MTYPNLLSSGIYFSIHRRRDNRNYLSKLITRYCTTRYLLCCSTFSLCSINRRSICYYRRTHSLISTIHRLYLKSNYNKNPILGNIYRSKHNIFSTTLSRTIRHTSTILRFSRCLYPMKYSILYWVNHFNSGSTYISIYCMRSFNM